MSRTRILIVLAPALVLLPFLSPGCSKPKGLSTEQRVELLPVENAAWRRIGYRYNWKVASPLAVDQSPVRTVVQGDLLITQSSVGSVTAFDKSTGEQIWNNNVSNPLTKYTGIAVDGERVIISSEADVFIVDAETGFLTDRQSYERLVNTPPLVQGNVVVVGSNGGELFGHFLATGFKAWGHGIGGVFVQKPVLVDGIIGAVNDRGRVIFVDPVTFRQTSQSEIFDGPGAPLGSGGGLLFVPSLDYSLYAFNPRERAPVWRHRTQDALRDPPVFYSGVVYCSFREAGMTALDAATGDVLWESPAVRGRVIGVRSGRLMVWDGRELSLLDPQRGVVIDTIGVPNVLYIDADQFEDGNIYITSNEGVVARFSPQN